MKLIPLLLGSGLLILIVALILRLKPASTVSVQEKSGPKVGSIPAVAPVALSEKPKPLPDEKEAQIAAEIEKRYQEQLKRIQIILDGMEPDQRQKMLK